MRVALSCCLVVAFSLCAQSSDVFEVASVRPSGPDTPARSTTDRSQFVATANTLVMLIASSYSDLPVWRISGGPPWASKDRWDFSAKLPPHMPADQEQLWRRTEQMLRTSLKAEFKLQTHFEPREQPVYELVLAKSGPKLEASATDQFRYRATAGGMDVQHITMSEFASLLYCAECPNPLADRVVVDKTGLTGYYDFNLNWLRVNNESDNANFQPSIFTAIQEQLGLKLQRGKGSVNFLVIDRAERPVQN